LPSVGPAFLGGSGPARCAGSRRWREDDGTRAEPRTESRSKRYRRRCTSSNKRKEKTNKINWAVAKNNQLLKFKKCGKNTRTKRWQTEDRRTKKTSLGKTKQEREVPSVEPRVACKRGADLAANGRGERCLGLVQSQRSHAALPHTAPVQTHLFLLLRWWFVLSLQLAFLFYFCVLFLKPFKERE